MADIAGWAQAGVAGLVAAVGTVFWAGSANRELADAHSQITNVQQQQKEDHDKIVGQEQKLNDIADDVSEIKSDVKSIARKIK